MDRKDIDAGDIINSELNRVEAELSTARAEEHRAKTRREFLERKASELEAALRAVDYDDRST